MSEIYGVNSQTYRMLPPEDQAAIRDSYLREQNADTPASPVAETPAQPPLPVPGAAEAQTPQQAVQAIHALPLPDNSDLGGGMPSYVYDSVYGPRVEAFNATRAEQAQAALDRFEPDHDSYFDSGLNGATASYEYQQAMSTYNNDPYVQELQRIADEATTQPGSVPAYLTGSDNTADTGTLSVQQMTDALGVLGVELPPNPTPEQVQAGYDILATAPDSVLGWAINPGSQVSFESSVAGAGTPGFIPLRANADISVIGEVELSDVQTGANFQQTQQFEMSVQMQGAVGGSFGRTPLNQLYGWAQRLNVLPQAATDLVNSSPILRNVVRGLPIPVSGNYEQFAGTRLTYEAVVTPEQGARLADGDLSATPNPLDPLSMPVGTSTLIRGQTLQGSSFEANYKLLHVNGESTSLEGQGFGVRRVDQNTFEVYSGPVDTVENEMFAGLGYRGLASVGLSVDRSLEQQSMSIARIDLRTEEGQAAYQSFMSSGQVPEWSPPGVSQSGTTEILDADHTARLGADIGGLSWGTELNSSALSIARTTWADGSVEQTNTYQVGDNHFSEVSFRTDASGNPVDGGTTYRVVLGNYDSSLASYLNDGYNRDLANPESSYGNFDGNQHVQLTFSESELLQLRDQAREFVLQVNGEYGQEKLDGFQNDSLAPFGMVENLAAADTPEEVYMIVSNDFYQFHMAGDLLGMSLQTGQALPGQITIRDAG